MSIRATPTQSLRDSEEPYACDREATYGRKVWFLANNSTLVAHTKLKTSMEINRVARQSFGILKIRKDRIIFELCLWKKKQKKKEDEQNRNFQLRFFQTC